MLAKDAGRHRCVIVNAYPHRRLHSSCNSLSYMRVTIFFYFMLATKVTVLVSECCTKKSRWPTHTVSDYILCINVSETPAALLMCCLGSAGFVNILSCHYVAEVVFLCSSLSVCRFILPQSITLILQKIAHCHFSSVNFLFRFFFIPTPPFVQCWNLSVSRGLDGCWHLLIFPCHSQLNQSCTT